MRIFTLNKIVFLLRVFRINFIFIKYFSIFFIQLSMNFIINARMLGLVWIAFNLLMLNDLQIFRFIETTLIYLVQIQLLLHVELLFQIFFLLEQRQIFFILYLLRRILHCMRIIIYLVLDSMSILFILNTFIQYFIHFLWLLVINLILLNLFFIRIFICITYFL